MATLVRVSGIVVTDNDAGKGVRLLGVNSQDREIIMPCIGRS